MTIPVGGEDDSNAPRSSTDNVMSWQAAPGVPVYGYTPGAPPPRIEIPWQFPQQQSVPYSQPMPPPMPAPQQQVQVPYEQPVVYTPQLEQPQQQQPVAGNGWLPEPLGPALTPEERMQQLQQSYQPPPPNS